jgi:hypothetical protein
MREVLSAMRTFVLATTPPKLRKSGWDTRTPTLGSK